MQNLEFHIDLQKKRCSERQERKNVSCKNESKITGKFIRVFYMRIYIWIKNCIFSDKIKIFLKFKIRINVHFVKSQLDGT